MCPSEDDLAPPDDRGRLIEADTILMMSGELGERQSARGEHSSRRAEPQEREALCFRSVHPPRESIPQRKRPTQLPQNPHRRSRRTPPRGTWSTTRSNLLMFNREYGAAHTELLHALELRPGDPHALARIEKMTHAGVL